MVYGATQPELTRPVPINLIRPDKAASVEHRAAFEIESAAVAIEHPNVIPSVEAELLSVATVHFAERAGEKTFDGRRRDAETVGDIANSRATRNKGRDLLFALREGIAIDWPASHRLTRVREARCTQQRHEDVAPQVLCGARDLRASLTARSTEGAGMSEGHDGDSRNGDGDPLGPDPAERGLWREDPGPLERRVAGAGWGFSRRTFLAGAGAVGGGAALDAALAKASQISSLPAGLQAVVGELPGLSVFAKPNLTFLLRRREDFLLLRVDGYNLGLHRQALVHQSRKHDAFIVFEFQPQHILEQAYLPKKYPKAPGRSKALLAYPSRIAFKLPAGRAIPLTVKGLLDWAALDPSLAPAAAYRPGAPHRPTSFKRPTGRQTAIELPWQLVISPTSVGRWSHPTEVITEQGWSELWHTRLAASAAEAALDGGPFRAIWNYDTDPANGMPTLGSSTPPAPSNDPFVASLNEFDRWEICTATSNFDLPGRADAQASKLWLSARGGFLDSIGDWNSTAFDIAEWKHQATLGRDQYVKVVYKGFLFPFGHRAVFVKVTEREFQKDDEQIVATLIQHEYVVIRDPTMSYDPSDSYGVANDSRDLPFRQLTITTPRSPEIKTPSFVKSFVPNPFVPTLPGGAPFQWHFVATDWNGQQVEFTAPAVFVYQDDGWWADHAADVRNQYNSLPATGSIRAVQFTGQEVAFAASHTPGDTNLSVQRITFGAGAGTGPISGGTDSSFVSADQAITFPTVAETEVVLTAAAQASGGSPLASNPIVAYDQTFVQNGFNSPANQGNLYMGIQGTGPALNFAQGSSGGVMTPNLQLTGLSRSLGPVAGETSNILNGTFDPASVFASSLNANILGGVKLIDLIQTATGISGDSPSTQAMQILYSTADPAGDAGQFDRAEFAPRITPPAPPIPTSRTTHFNWSPDIVSDNPIVSMAPGLTYAFTLNGVVTTDLVNPANSTFALTGQLDGFVVTLMTNQDETLEFIAITFNSLTFNAASGQKSTVSVDIDSVAFLGVLKFIQQLEEFMDFSGDGGPTITIQPDGISADLAVSLPPIAVGVFSLSNIAVDAGFNLPFDGSPARFRFSFSTQDDPFTLSVAIFGGGGFFGIAIGTDGVELIQASFDFGAMAAIDLGVASGSVQLVAGIYFAYGEIAPPSTQTGCILTGFVKLDGSLSVLGIITLSLTFDLSLTYEDLGGVSEVTGTATLTVSISILFFSASVSMTATKTFGGGQDGSNELSRDRSRELVAHIAGDSPPTFADQVSQTDWSTYCSAFGS